MHLVEIGVGFGGFAALLLRLHPEIASYTLVDLPEVLNIAQVYMREAGLSAAIKLRYLNAAPCGSVTDGGMTGTRASDFMVRQRGYDLVISMAAFAEVPALVRRAYFESILSRSTRGFVSDHPRQLTRLKLLPLLRNTDSSVQVVGQAEWKEIHQKQRTSATSLLVPAMLLNHRLARIGAPAAPGVNSPNVSAVIVIRELMKGYSPHGAHEATVAWGLKSDYYPELVQKMRDGYGPDQWQYPVRKLTIREPFYCMGEWAGYAPCDMNARW